MLELTQTDPVLQPSPLQIGRALHGQRRPCEASGCRHPTRGPIARCGMDAEKVRAVDRACWCSPHQRSAPTGKWCMFARLTIRSTACGQRHRKMPGVRAWCACQYTVREKEMIERISHDKRDWRRLSRFKRRALIRAHGQFVQVCSGDDEVYCLRARQGRAG